MARYYQVVQVIGKMPVVEDRGNLSLVPNNQLQYMAGFRAVADIWFTLSQVQSIHAYICTVAAPPTLL